MSRYTDDFRALNAMRRAQAKHEAGPRIDADGFTMADHLRELELTVANLKRAVNAGVPGSIVFEGGQAVARIRAITCLARVQELLS
ncbi:hypothetical protein GCM10007320_09020 [Pseudorhodoferax aquiterrae]|uniref:Uncharacterized protein n=1 Tax=Pseudorhodoferax aquiterrae TaxID=747304 RepID=A0ABQ3FX62_9BURK|nr:hypothetical protein [Pseudorhodoferax aquiterrae]GHC72850.1 hypothetical protein GCM10007320_09020 [Pseudorhodoferax aquiterrae]